MIVVLDALGLESRQRRSPRLRQPHDPRPLRPHHRRVLGLGRLRHTRARIRRGREDLDAGFWTEAFSHFQRLLSPWLSLVDSDRWYAQDLAKLVDDPDLRTIAAAHTPPITGARVGQALEMMGRIPAMAPEQADLDAMLAAMNAKVA